MSGRDPKKAGNDVNDRARRILTWISLAGFLLIYIIDPTKKMTDPTEQLLAKAALLRASATLVLICCAWTLRLKLFEPFRVKDLALFLPALAVAVNNFPWLPLCMGDATLTNGYLVGWLIFHVLCVGALEELAFRGMLLPLLIRRFGRTKRALFKSVILSSIIFGFVHFLNLIEGAGVAETLLQVGYSMLTGAMCAVLFLGTGNLAYCIATHAIFNFGGGAIAFLAEGAVWTIPNIVGTVIVGVAVGAWMIFSFCRLDPQTTPVFEDTPDKNQSEKGD